MKKIIIVNNNMRIGGVQKSLYNLLWSIDTVNEYDVTLLLFSKSGEYVGCLPENIKIKECKGPFRYLGKGQGEYRNKPIDFIFRGFFAALCRLFGRAFALRLMLLAEPMIDGKYDCAVSFLHNGQKNGFFGGVQDYVLSRIKAKKKIAFIHGDHVNCGGCYTANNRMLRKFDAVAACSDGCREVLVRALPELDSKCETVRNFNRYDEIIELSEDNPVEYDSSFINAVMVARLSEVKGIERAIEAVSFCSQRKLRVNLHIVGGGHLSEKMKRYARDVGADDRVYFYGEQKNPYRYMKNSDILLITSYHEAAPMVIDEAFCLSLPVFSTKTTSTDEMIIKPGYGWVCENSQDALNSSLYEVMSDRQKLIEMKNKLSAVSFDNSDSAVQFRRITEI